jgi:DNA-binding GntR family transcriptional regulator
LPFPVDPLGKAWHRRRVKTPPRQSAVDSTAAALRGLSLASPEGSFLGNEEALVNKLGAARNTVRQAARLLEREGVVRVRCGLNGGYFAARPDLDTIEHAVSAYLTAIAVSVEDVTYVASLLWVEAVRRAAGLPADLVRPVAEELMRKVKALAPDASFEALFALERENRSAMFALTGSAYIELIFQINHTFAESSFTDDLGVAASAEHSTFVTAWRDAKLMELAAIMDGDERMATIAAQHVRNIWQNRFWDAPRNGEPRELAQG